MSQRGGKAREGVGGGKDDIATCILFAGVTVGTVIAAIGFDSAAIGVDGVEFRFCASSERIDSFEEHASVAKDIGGESAAGDEGERDRFF